MQEADLSSGTIEVKIEATTWKDSASSETVIAATTSVQARSDKKSICTKTRKFVFYLAAFPKLLAENLARQRDENSSKTTGINKRQ